MYGAERVPLAKSLTAIDRLSGGRLLAAVGPGSSSQDYAAVDLDFSERWRSGPADRMLGERVIPTVHRPEDMLRERVPIGSAELFAEKLTDFARAGVQRVYIWPIADERRQLERFWSEVRPLVAA
jgi:alkanesulfonate monooxygenase SsuD/methylene tetrahydromethanopterin reductase-like flavin-dependent oxidoreductase (luciferase family)